MVLYVHKCFITRATGWYKSGRKIHVPILNVQAVEDYCSKRQKTKLICCLNHSSDLPYWRRRWLPLAVAGLVARGRSRRWRHKLGHRFRPNPLARWAASCHGNNRWVQRREISRQEASDETRMGWSRASGVHQSLPKLEQEGGHPPVEPEGLFFQALLKEKREFRQLLQTVFKNGRDRSRPLLSLFSSFQ